MMHLAEQFPHGRPPKPAPTAGAIGVERAPRDPAISPQDFYREMVERPDVRQILTRLAQVEDGTA